MKSVYRINVQCYSWDNWQIFTESEDVFNIFQKLYNTDEAREEFGVERWEELIDADYVFTPYILLGETELRQHD